MAKTPELLFKNVSRSKKDTAGVTKVFNIDGDLGTVAHMRGTTDYDAILVDGTSLGVFSTMAQAGHALRRHVRDAILDATTASAAPAAAATVVIEEDELPETEIESDVETGAEAVAEDIAKDVGGEAA